VNRFPQSVAQWSGHIPVEVANFVSDKACVEFIQSDLLEIVTIDDGEFREGAEIARRNFNDGFRKSAAFV
jgi:hypothetical protein